ncbi:hypothetical protein AC1031_009944 [Aphanomyces cochlioides]|nr:hypothetical protein AC1031_009944 [Aphanomyces cochlioides]
MPRLSRCSLSTAAVFMSLALPASCQSICDEPLCINVSSSTPCNPRLASCPPCWSRRSDQILCKHAATPSECMDGTICSPIASFVRRLGSDPTTPPSTSQPSSVPSNTTAASETKEGSNSMTVWYTLACIGLCCLVLALYAVLRWANRRNAAAAATDNSKGTAFNRGPATGDKPDLIDPLSRPPDDTLSLSRAPQNLPPASEPATFSIFHTVGRHSPTDHGAGFFNTMGRVSMNARDQAGRDSAASMFIMEESELWELQEDYESTSDSGSDVTRIVI